VETEEAAAATIEVAAVVKAAAMVRTAAMVRMAAMMAETVEADVTDRKGGGSGRDGVDGIAERTLVRK
jgi:hypothetical protein